MPGAGTGGWPFLSRCPLAVHQELWLVQALNKLKFCVCCAELVKDSIVPSPSKEPGTLSPVPESQMRIVPSAEHDRICCPSAEKTAKRTTLV